MSSYRNFVANGLYETGIDKETTAAEEVALATLLTSRESGDSGYGSIGFPSEEWWPADDVDEIQALPEVQIAQLTEDLPSSDIGTSVQWKESATIYQKNDSHSSSPTDRNSTHSSIRDYDHGASIGTSTESDMSDDTASPSPENDAWLIVAHAKHRMMISLMRDVYTIFDPHWKADVRNNAGTRAASTGQNSSSRTPPSTAKSKRRLQDRDSPPPDGNDEKKRKPKSSNSGDDGQHLRRIHRAPAHCPRCWLVLESQAEMSVHANLEERCEQQEPQIIEGVDEDKIRLITETWGVSWEGIYEILFPGAPIPSPYYEAEDPVAEILGPSSPGSRELRDFEVYSRTTLPLLVEANLRVIVESQVVPIEERVRAMVVDIVRTCQSTVARTFHLTIAPTSLVQDRGPSTTQASASNDITAHTQEEPVHGSAYGTAGNSLNFFQEHSPINAEASASLPTPMYDHNNSINHQSQSQDSGYGTLTDTCDCICHYDLNTRITTVGQSNCLNCDSNHINLDDFDFDSFPSAE